MSDIPRFLIVGAGSFGTALAIVINRAGSRAGAGDSGIVQATARATAQRR